MRVELFFREGCPESLKVQHHIQRQGFRNRVHFHNVQSEERAQLKLVSMTGEDEAPCLAVDDRPLLGSDDIIAWLDSHLA